MAFKQCCWAACWMLLAGMGVFAQGAEQPRLIKRLTGHRNLVWSVAFSPDGKTLASGSRDRTVKLCDPVAGKCRATLECHADVVFAVAFSPDGKLLASGSWDNTVMLVAPDGTFTCGADSARGVMSCQTVIANPNN